MQTETEAQCREDSEAVGKTVPGSSQTASQCCVTRGKSLRLSGPQSALIESRSEHEACLARRVPRRRRRLYAKRWPPGSAQESDLQAIGSSEWEGEEERVDWAERSHGLEVWRRGRGGTRKGGEWAG